MHTQSPRHLNLALLPALLAAALLLGLPAAAGAKPRGHGAQPGGDEIQFSSEEFKKLDTFEAHALNKGDDAYAKKDYKKAAAEYDAFLVEFPKSRATAYAVLRKARCLHQEKKRFEARKAYQEVLDYFPNHVPYAAAALYYIGQTHWEDGKEEDGLRAWAKLADDADYRTQPLAANAILMLCESLLKQDQAEKASQYYRQTAIDFRVKNPEAALRALRQAVYCLVRLKPDEPALREFYTKVQGFGGRARRVPADLDQDRDYWDAVRQAVRRHDQFQAVEAPVREAYFRYWAKALSGRFPEWDEYQLDLAEFHLVYEKEPAKWVARLDEQYRKYDQPGNYDRLLLWIRQYAKEKTKLNEYYAKLNFAKMSNDQILDLMKMLYEVAGNEAMGRSVMEKVRLAELADTAKAELAKYFWKIDPTVVATVCAAISDADFRDMQMLLFHQSQSDLDKGIPLADKLSSVPVYAKEALWIKGDMFFAAKQFDKAIPAYQQVNDPPKNLWKLAECYIRLQKYPQALQQLSEIETFFKDQSPQAAMAIADVYKTAGQEKQEIAALRRVMRSYAGSSQYSAAHHRLEQKGVKIGGGEGADD